MKRPNGAHRRSSTRTLLPVPQGGKLLGSPSGFIFEQRVVLSEGGAITAASKTISDRMEGSGAGVKETSD
ncbi:hypothetical protein Bca4012_050781 [Brassica carinata]|uniref:Uncharacterized protein n=1 Tax=Brassica carinata TaxID=52824 RepID=A0A8X7R605_BRACI|nr:hypothetical protein Bca52824_053482 [Brassica carinata]